MSILKIVTIATLLVGSLVSTGCATAKHDAVAYESSKIKCGGNGFKLSAMERIYVGDRGTTAEKRMDAAEVAKTCGNNSVTNRTKSN